LRGAIPEIHRLGAELIFLGNGTAEQARAFAEREGLTAPVLTDPQRSVYRAAGARRGLSALRPAVIRNALRARRGGFKQRGLAGDPLQLGGVLVIKAGGEVAWRHMSGALGDHPAAETILSVLRSL